MVRRLHMVPWIQDKTISLVEQFPPESHLIILYRQLYLEQHRSAESFDIVQDSRAGTTAPSGRIHRKMLSVQITVSEVPECKKTVRPVFLPVSVKSQKMQTNPNGAQLICTTHDANLLDLAYLRRDQIWFTEKDRTESSDLYSLVEFKDGRGVRVRNDSSIEKDYIEGRYGAIPFLHY